MNLQEIVCYVTLKLQIWTLLQWI